jgi:hypothetical protein
MSLVKGCGFLHIFQTRNTGKRNQGALAIITRGKFFAVIVPHISSLRMMKTFVKRMDMMITVGMRIQSFPFMKA